MLKDIGIGIVGFLVGGGVAFVALMLYFGKNFNW